MNEEDRRYLTEWGGDCWHEFDWAVGGRRCKKCGEWDLENRTFDTWADFGWLWERFITREDSPGNLSPWLWGKGLVWYDWLLKKPDIRCQIICDFLRENEITDTLAIKEQEGKG